MTRSGVTISTSVIIALGLAVWFGVSFQTRRGLERTISDQQLSLPLLERKIQELVRQGDPPPAPSVETAAQIPLQPSVSEALSDLEVASAEAGVILEGVRSTRVVGDRQLYQLTGRGGMREFCALLAAIEAMKRLILIEKVRILARPNGEMYFDVQTASFHDATGGR